MGVCCFRYVFRYPRSIVLFCLRAVRSFCFFGDRIHLKYEVWTFIIIESISSYSDGPGAVLDFKLQLLYVTNNFYYYFYIRFIVRRGGASCWTLHIVYATPLAPMPVSPLPP